MHNNENQEFKDSVRILFLEGAYAALVLLVLSGIEVWVENLPLKQDIKGFILTVHERSVITVFIVLAIKSVLRVIMSNWRLLWKAIKQDS